MHPRIRLATGADSPAILDIYGPVVRFTPTSFEVSVPTVDEMAQRIETTTRQYPWLVLERDGRVAGYAYASQHRARAAYQWSAEVSAYVHPDYRRGGVGKALYTSLFEILTLQGYCNALAGIALPNPGSVGFHEAMGFEPVGVFRAAGFKLGAWHDIGWWQRRLQQPAGTPEPPRPVGAIQADARWDAALACGLALLHARAGCDRGEA